jgi:predicted DNA-binding transcriptional regulator AlpA
MAKSTVRIVEIAELLGVSHQRASKIADQPGFPAPVGREGQSRLWDRREVTAWAKVWRREGPGARRGTRAAAGISPDKRTPRQRCRGHSQFA